MSLHDLAFSDLFVTDDVATSWFKPAPDSLLTQPVPPECGAEMAELRRQLDDRPIGPSAFRIDWPDASGIRLRVERMTVSDSRVIYVCRRFRQLIGTLAGLGVPVNVAEKLLAPDLQEGLVVFLGKAGSGKTTTAASFISERLSRFGGVCWTIENPVELHLQGKHGKGWCYQTEATSDDDIGPAVRNMLRATPNIIFIGELRDRRAVREAMAAATSGHLVVTTFHAANLLGGIARLARMAGDDAVSSAVLADALRVAVHLSLNNTEAKGAAASQRVLSVEPLWMTWDTSDGLRSIVRDGDFHLLKSEVERQRRSFLTNKQP